jgi:uncharacterized damage-inducible protein DinB
VLGEGLEKGTLEWVEIAAPTTMREVVEVYNREHDAVTARFRNLDAAKWQARVPFMFQGQAVMNETGFDNAWGFLLDIIHHRGQLSTYLRPMGSTVPAIYGPSADESM